MTAIIALVILMIIGIILAYLSHRHEQLEPVRSRLKSIDKRAWKRFKRNITIYNRSINVKTSTSKRIYVFRNDANIIACLFYWDTSKEGFSYWKDVDKQYKLCK